MRRFAVSLVALALVSTALAVSAAGRPAWACSCAVLTEAEYADMADVVFAGTLTRIDTPGGGQRSSMDPATLVFAVDTVFKGATAEVQNVVTARDGASCGLEGLSAGGEFMVYSTTDSSGGPVGQPGDLYSNLCSGTGPWDGSAVPAGLAGPGTAPTEPSPETAPSATLAADVPSSDGGWSTNDWLLAAVVAVPLVATLGLAVTMAVRRRR
jgi:hypothetical protein